MPATRANLTEDREGGPQPIRENMAASSAVPVSHNLNGQKLGRKGRVTRERILAATVELLESEEDDAISLSAVARKASLGMSSLYNYFTDFTEVLLAVLEPVMATAEEAYLGLLREYWPDKELNERCYTFVSAYHHFWAKNSRLLHLRNSMADKLDVRMMHHRVQSTQPVIMLLVKQMDGDPSDFDAPGTAMATVVMTGLERSITIATDRQFPKLMGWEFRQNKERFLRPGARLMEMAIRDIRSQQG